MDVVEFETDAIDVMDLAYVDFEALWRMDRVGAFFITRAKENMLFEIIETNYNIDQRVGLRSDQTISLMGIKTSKLHPKYLRKVVDWDNENDATLTFITNNFELSALDIARLYQYRWQIEVFFKWIKQNLTHQ